MTLVRIVVLVVVLLLASCAQLGRTGQQPVPGPTGTGVGTGDATPEFGTPIPAGVPEGEQETQVPPVTG
ncbi:MAG: hypothetical protein ACRDI0_05980 [Actinomycetota bacterium]